MVYIIFHNQTDALYCQNGLRLNHINGLVVKAPRIKGTGSCAWAVKIKDMDLERARYFCVMNRIAPCAWHSEV